MRRSGFILTLVTVLLSACSKAPEFSEQGNIANVKGAVEVTLSAVNDHELVIPVKSTVDVVPPVDSFKIEIFDEAGTRIYRDKYVNTVANGPIYLNGGKHKLLASHGYALGVGFNAIYFAVEEPFTILGQDVVPVTAVAKMANVKVSVNFGQNLKDGYPDFYARVKSSKVNEYLEFKKAETRAGYIPASDLTFELYALIDGVWKYFPAPSFVANPNEYITFNVDTDPREKDITVSVKIDNTVDVVEKSFVIPADALPQAAPAVSTSGAFDATGLFRFLSGKNYEGTQIDVFAEGGIQSCVVDVTSEYLTTLGLPAQVDILTPGAAGQDILKNIGINWFALAGEKYAAIDFTNIGSKLTFDAGKPFEATFKLTVTDASGVKTVSDVYTLVHLPEITLAPQPYNAFAKRMVGLNAEAVTGDANSVGLQWSADKNVWNDVVVKTVSGKKVDFETITGLNPSTEYFLRTIYNNDQRKVSDPVSLTTEVDAQVGNNNFEDWKTEKFQFESQTAGFLNCDWYVPYTNPADSWWAVNSKTTMRSWCSGSFAGIGSNYNLKVFPTVSYYNNGTSRSAQLASVATGKSGTATGPGTVEVQQKPGEMWIGTAKEGDFSGGGGQHATDGHAFGSRPSAVSFNYQYIPYKTEKFYVKVELKDANGVVLFTKEITDGSNAATTMTIPVTYTDITKKAANIYVCFKSSTLDTPGYSKQDIDMPNGKQNACVGSILRIDNIQMIYE